MEWTNPWLVSAVILTYCTFDVLKDIMDGHKNPLKWHIYKWICLYSATGVLWAMLPNWGWRLNILIITMSIWHGIKYYIGRKRWPMFHGFRQLLKKILGEQDEW